MIISSIISVNVVHTIPTSKIKLVFRLWIWVLDVDISDGSFWILNREPLCNYKKKIIKIQTWHILASPFPRVLLKKNTVLLVLFIITKYRTYHSLRICFKIEFSTNKFLRNHIDISSLNQGTSPIMFICRSLSHIRLKTTRTSVVWSRVARARWWSQLGVLALASLSKWSKPLQERTLRPGSSAPLLDVLSTLALRSLWRQSLKVHRNSIIILL